MLRLTLDFFVLGIEDLACDLAQKLPQVLSVVLQKLESVIAPHGCPGEQDVKLLDEDNRFLKRAVVLEFSRRAL